MQVGGGRCRVSPFCFAVWSPLAPSSIGTPASLPLFAICGQRAGVCVHACPHLCISPHFSRRQQLFLSGSLPGALFYVVYGAFELHFIPNLLGSPDHFGTLDADDSKLPIPPPSPQILTNSPKTTKACAQRTVCACATRAPKTFLSVFALVWMPPPPPSCRGHVHIRSKDPRQQPAIQPNYLCRGVLQPETLPLGGGPARQLTFCHFSAQYPIGDQISFQISFEPPRVRT